MFQLRALLPLLGGVALAAACSTAPGVAKGPSTPRGGSPTGPALAASAPAGACASVGAGHPTPIDAGRGDRVVLARDKARTIAYVANEDDGAVHTIDVSAGTELAVTPLTGSPSALVGLRDGRIVVALRDRNEVTVLEPAADLTSPLSARCSRSVASEPVGLAATEKAGDDERILVASAYGHALTVLHDGDLAVALRADLRRDPRAVVANGGRAFVSHVSSSELSAVDLETGVVAKVDVLGGQTARGFSFRSGPDVPEEPQAIRGGQVFSLATSEGRLFAPMVTVDPGEPKITGAYGSTEVPIKPFVGVVDLASTRQLPLGVPSQRSASRRACMLPRAAAAAPGGRLFVTCAGTDELLELDARADNAAQAIRRRVRLPAGPLGLAIDAKEAVVMAQFNREVVIVALDGDAPTVTVGLSRPDAPVDAELERGRKIFHDSFDLRVSGDGRACASCHPDGRDDGNTWSTPDGPRQTITLAGRVARSGPYGWFGDHPTLDSHLSETMRRLGGGGFSAPSDRKDLAALETYLARMKAPVAAAADDPHVAEGRALFNDARQGCATCHALGDTDRARHDVGSGHREEASLRFDTPSLLFVAASGPYFHDGRYATLGELLEKSDDRMGHARHLSSDQRVSLVAYMETLAPAPAAAEVARRFVRPASVEPVAPDASSGIERQALASEPPPRVLAPVEIDLGAIPTVDVTRPLEWDTKAPAAQGTALADGEMAWKNGCAAVAHHAAAHLKFDWRESAMTSALERCVGAPDVDGMHRWSEMSMTTIDPTPDGRLHVVERQGFVRLGGTEVRVSSSVSVDAVRLGEGLAFAYRTRCADCKEGERDLLHIVGPSEGEDIFTTFALSLERDRAAHSGVSVAPWHLESWSKATGTHLESGSTLGEPRSIPYRVDASRTRSEEEARVTIGRGTCKPDFFSCN